MLCDSGSAHAKPEIFAYCSKLFMASSDLSNGSCAFSQESVSMQRKTWPELPSGTLSCELLRALVFLFAGGDVLRLRGLPWSAGPSEVAQFLHELPGIACR